MASKITNVSNYVSVGIFQSPSAKGGLSQSFPKMLFHAAFLHLINYTFAMYSQYYATKSSCNNFHQNIDVCLNCL